MPQASYEYAVGRVSVLFTKMLDASQIRRISEAASEAEALALLLETGYGGNLSAGQINTQEIDYVIRAQLQISRQKIWELTPAPELTSLFLLQVDVHNIKTLLKARLLGVDAPDVLIEGGIFPLDFLHDAITNKYYGDMPSAFRVAMDKIEVELQHNVDPLRFSAELDGAMFKHIKTVLDEKHDNSFVREYFGLMADFQNARSVVRSRLLHWEADKLKPLLLECGDIEHSLFLEAMETPFEQLGAKLNHGKHGKVISQTIEEYVSTKDPSVLKRKMETALMNVLRGVKWDTFTLGPIIGYLMAREAEAKALRVIFGAKRGGFEAELPELYA
ncbi:MAG: V-type ATPase subunit [Acidaminococcaceae bacterium]|nr:V-type ATPase subunit [Acidaminococcaceae bacterium]MDD4721322.1 V-type ATPase subunit [Acidaminococcaceae bacterium]